MRSSTPTASTTACDTSLEVDPFSGRIDLHWSDFVTELLASIH